MVDEVLFAGTVPEVSDIIGAEGQALLRKLITQLSAHHWRNTERAHYYDSKAAFRDLGISIPPNLRNLEVALGWPAKAVDSLARRIRMTGFVLPGSDTSAFGIDDIVTDNEVLVQHEQATTSALIHGVAFIVSEVTRDGDVSISVHDARTATGIWGRHGLDSALILRSSEHGLATGWLLLTRNSAAEIELVDGQWYVAVTNHNLDRVPVEPLVYRPRLGRRFGSSRISRGVMALTDSALRTIARMEVGAEFFSAPQRYILGADEEAFVDGLTGEQKSLWSLITGRMLALPDATDASGNEIKVGQFPQISMQPHGDMLRTIAGAFAGETGLPVAELGITFDNPASAEATYAAKEQLIIEAEGASESFGRAWSRAIQTAVMWRDGLDRVPPELRKLGVRWRDPSTPSRAQATDAVMKQVAAGVLPADSEVALELLGYDRLTIERIKAHRAEAVDPFAAITDAIARQTTEG